MVVGLATIVTDVGPLAPLFRTDVDSRPPDYEREEAQRDPVTRSAGSAPTITPEPGPSLRPGRDSQWAFSLRASAGSTTDLAGVQDLCQVLFLRGRSITRDCRFPPGLAAALRRDGRLIVAVQRDTASGRTAVFGLGPDSLQEVTVDGKVEGRISRPVRVVIPTVPDQLLDEVEGATRAELLRLPGALRVRAFIADLPPDRPGGNQRIPIAAGFDHGRVTRLSRPASGGVITRRPSQIGGTPPPRP